MGRALLPYDAPIPAMAGLTGFSSVTYQSTMKYGAEAVNQLNARQTASVSFLEPK